MREFYRTVMIILFFPILWPFAKTEKNAEKREAALEALFLKAKSKEH